MDYDFEAAADAILKRHGCAGIYSESELGAKFGRELLAGDLSWCESRAHGLWRRCRSDGMSLAQIMRYAKLTKKQKKVVKLRCAGEDEVESAQQLRMTLRAYREVFARARERILDTVAEIDSDEPSEFGLRLFISELAYKKRMTYRKRKTPWRFKRLKGMKVQKERTD